jgi:hypothetical protein
VSGNSNTVISKSSFTAGRAISSGEVAMPGGRARKARRPGAFFQRIVLNGLTA